MTDLATVQRALRDDGYPPGPIDGLMGPKTRNAIRAFERANGLPVDGQIDATFMARLIGPGATAMRGTRPEIRQGRAGYLVTEVVLHTSATRGDWHEGKTAEDMMAEIRRWHTSPGWQGAPNGWRREGYHGLSAPDGTRAAGRPYTMIGAHVKERNRGTIGLCLIPSVTITRMGRFDDFYTEAQRRDVRAWIAELARETPIALVTGHNQYANKLCPGFRVRSEDWL